MGYSSLNSLNTIAVLLVAYVAIFLEAWAQPLRAWLGAQIDVVPALMVYCGLSTGWVTLTLTAVCAGVWYDSLSANPLGISIVPQFLVGFATYQARELILREQPYARMILGMVASVAAPILTVLFLLGGGYKPLIGWGSLWQLVILCLGGGIVTPGFFWLFGKLDTALAYRRTSETTFRPDREIKRGRN
jgi:rod shape-determining protein MreD